MNRSFLRVVSALAVSALCGGIADAQTHPALDVPGLQENRDYSSAMPFEHIDTFSGSLVLTFTDLVLPGNAGRQLRFQRTFNSKPAPYWIFGIEGIPLSIEDSVDPLPHTPCLIHRNVGRGLR